MQNPDQRLVHRLIGGDPSAPAALVAAASESDDPVVLVAAATFAGGPPELVDRAACVARSTSDRQLVAIAMAFRRGDHDLVDALARDHLADHPASVLVAWIASVSQTSIKETS